MERRLWVSAHGRCHTACIRVGQRQLRRPATANALVHACDRGRWRWPQRCPQKYLQCLFLDAFLGVECLERHHHTTLHTPRWPNPYVYDVWRLLGQPPGCVKARLHACHGMGQDLWGEGMMGQGGKSARGPMLSAACKMPCVVRLHEIWAVVDHHDSGNGVLSVTTLWPRVVQPRPGQPRPAL